MIILFVILLIVLLAVLYYDVRVVTSKLPKDVFRFYDFSQRKFLARDVFIIKPLKNDDLYEPEISNEKEKVILYIHGGSYVGELEKYHWNFFKDIINDTKATVIVPDYPLAPEHTYLEVFKIMEPLYKEITDKIDEKEFILMGDSAGGGLALGLYEKMAEETVELPVKTILISPWLDVRLENEKIQEIEKKDTILNKEALRLAGIAYAGNDGINSYLVNPVEGDVSKLQNIKIYIGTEDILNPDCHLLKERADAVNGEVEIKEYENAKHIWIIDNNSEEEITKQAYNDVIEDLKNS